MPFEETDTENSLSSLCEASSFDDGFDRMKLEFDGSDEESTDGELDSYVWKQIESDAEFLKDHGLVEEVTSVSNDNTIDYCRYSITSEMIGLLVSETNRYVEHYLKAHQISRRSKFRQWKPTTDEKMVKFFGIIMEMESVQMSKLEDYTINGDYSQCHVERSVE